ncbi:MAG: hypothetical protein M1828_000399 [Chrysothrix sp. TS-e1954]|nr:MAG: hypothetical protein M1828_000399 [Chrysothrix sp. TS-e1954]
MPLHYRNTPQSNSNPFNNYQPAQQPTHPNLYQHTANPSTSFQPHQLNHNANPSAGFPTPHQNGNLSLFGSGAGLTNGAFANGGGTGLGSHEAQLGFERGAALQRQQQQQQQTGQQGQMTAELLAGAGGVAGGISRSQGRIREVWAGNLEQEMDLIRTLILRYPCVSMDTEFPGIVARPIGQFPTKADYHYQCLRCNVDLLKLIQLGLTLFTTSGDLPPLTTDPSEAPPTRTHYTATSLTRCPCTWTFNFKFSLTQDMFAQDSIELLQKAGVDFAKTESQGIPPQSFASLLITSGLVLDPQVSWLSYHGGYDFGYLLKITTCLPLPADEETYLSLVRAWFPRIYDIKFLFKHAQTRAQKGILTTSASETLQSLGHRSSLQDLADGLGVPREGRPHTAGSDAWLTGLVFWTLRQKLFDGAIPEDLVGQIWGISAVGPPASSASQAASIASLQASRELHAAVGGGGQGQGFGGGHGHGQGLGSAHGQGLGSAQGHVQGHQSRGDVMQTPQQRNQTELYGGGLTPSTPQGLGGTPGLHGAFGAQSQQQQGGGGGGQGGGGMAGMIGGVFGGFGYGR